MVGRRTSPDAVRRELRQVDAAISAHPFASPRVRAANETVAEHKARGAAAVDRELAGKGLPGAVELGKVYVAGTWSWWRLHRRRRQLQRELDRVDR